LAPPAAPHGLPAVASSFMRLRTTSAQACDTSKGIGTRIASIQSTYCVGEKAMKELTNLFRKLASDESGASMAEYAMILAVTVVFVAAGVSTIEHPIDAFFNSAGQLFQDPRENVTVVTPRAVTTPRGSAYSLP
jgi:Flp pilus assembly pilin Flp